MFPKFECVRTYRNFLNQSIEVTGKPSESSLFIFRKSHLRSYLNYEQAQFFDY